MIKSILTSTLLAGTLLINAQNLPTTAPSAEQVGQETDKNINTEKVKKTPEEKATLQTEKLKSACGDITAEQEAKIKAIFLARATKIAALKANSNNKLSRKEEIKPIFAQSNQELKAILTVAQFEKLKSMRKNNREKLKNNKGKVRGNTKDKKNDDDDNNDDDDDNEKEDDKKETKENKKGKNK